MSKNKLLLIDGHSIAFRAFYALHSQLERMKNSSGLHTNALYGFHSMLENVVEKENPSHVMVAFDAGSTTFRNELFDDYKGGRDSMPTELSEQMPYLKEMLDGFAIKYYELPDYEADDIIGTLSKQAEKDDFDVVIITGDKDLTQLATDKIRVDYTIKDRQDAWYESDVSNTAWVYKDGDKVIALSPVCKHLGCTVNWAGDDTHPNEYYCPCHGGRYEKNGDNIPGTPPLGPLDQYEVEVVDGFVHLGKTIPNTLV